MTCPVTFSMMCETASSTSITVRLRPPSVAGRFLHLESIEQRARVANSHIRPHCHANLSHASLIHSGGGQMIAESQPIVMRPPCLVFVPSAVAHGFELQAGTRGVVLTLSDAYLAEIFGRSTEFLGLFAAPRQVPVSSERQSRTLLRSFKRLSRELTWHAPCHGAAVEAELLCILVCAVRLAPREPSPSTAWHGGEVKLVARFRAMVERCFRSNVPIPEYLHELGTTYARLHTACTRVAACTPLQIIRERTLLEAKRLLIYSNLTVAETAYQLGFDDPAYFSRFFSRHAGHAPRDFRKRHCDGGGNTAG